MFWNWVIVAALILFSNYLSSYFMNFETQWYTSLKKPSYQPPPIAFGIVWTILYLILWYSISVSYPKDRSIFYYFVLLLTLFVVWAYVLFGLQSLGGAAVVLFITLIVSLVLWKKIIAVSNNQIVPSLFLLFVVWIFIANTLSINLAIIN
jgi:benzodiazapine receptor